jgi:hypothetical protein
MEYELRSYRVKPGQMKPFLEVFDKVVEARRAHGFTVEGVWYSEADDVFTWVVSHEGPFDAAVERYYESEERKAIEPSPASFLDEVETFMVERHR